ncbi:MAG: glycosyltransferase [Bacteroidia bacterium]
MKKVVLSVTNDFTADQRIQRMANYLVTNGFEVCVIARKLPNSLPLDKFSYKIIRMNLCFKKGKFFYLEYQIRLFFQLLFLAADIFTANDLDTLLPNFLVARLRKKRLIYDTHEYFTQVPELIHRPFTQKIWTTLEQWIFPKLETTITVNDSLVRIYGELYQKKVHAIYNVPTRKEILHAKNAQPKVLIYQGALNKDRGIELMIATMAFLPDYELWIVGRGDIEENIKAQAISFKNVVFKGFFKPNDLYLLTQQATLGLSLEKAEALNYVYASPNKVFDYVQAEVPVLISDFPENRKLLEQYQVGEIVPLAAQNPADLSQKIREMCEDEAKYQHYVATCKTAKLELCWEKESQKLAAIYGTGESVLC